jgi:hypothetical protein
VIPLVGPDRIGDAALVFLRAVAPRIAGQLTDALLDSGLAVTVRRSLPRVLELARSARAVEGLCVGLDDEDFAVREACARAAVRTVTHDAKLSIPASRAAVFAEQELARDAAGWRDGTPPRDSNDDPVLLDRVEAAHVVRRIEHIFTLLALALGPDLMAATLRSLYGSDPHLRGTALEYLQTTLPESLRRALWRHLPGAKAASSSRRSAPQIADELMRTSQRLTRVDPEG